MNASFTGSLFYRVALAPAAVFLSVIFGGSYGSGQEVVQFVSAAGPVGGYWALLAIVLIWGLLLGLSFEIARRFNAYEYAGFMRVLLNKGWFAYECVILVSMVLVLAICAAGAGTVLGEQFGISIWLGSFALLAIAVALNYCGRNAVERSMMISVIVLLTMLSLLCVNALPRLSWPQAQAETANPLLSGAQYAIVNGGFIPLLLYCGRGVRTRAQAFAAGFCAAGAAAIPGLLLHTSFLASYPDALGQSLPAYWAIGQLMPPIFLSIYVLVLFVMITQTAVGMVHGLAARMDQLSAHKRNRALSKAERAGIAAILICGAMLLADIGFVTLIAKGYDVLVVLFVLIFVAPLLSYGAWLAFRKPTA